jgi:site-specific recombinase XerC
VHPLVQRSGWRATGGRTISGPQIAANAAARRRRMASPETQRLYAVDWKGFVAWCAEPGLVALPAEPATIAAFLTAGAQSLSAGALSRRAAAIGDKHRHSGLASPVKDPAVKAVLRDARRTAMPRRDPPHRPGTLISMAARCPRDPAGLRDRALLLLAAQGLGRAALVGLDFEHLNFTATTVELAIGAGLDPGSGQQTFVVHRGASLAVCPVQALRAWLNSSNTRFGPVFRKIDRWDSIEHHRLSTDAIRRILARRALRRGRQSRRKAAA